MRLRHLLRRLGTIAVAAATLGTLSMTPVSAQAQPQSHTMAPHLADGLSDCQVGLMCVWSETNFTGFTWGAFRATPSGSCRTPTLPAVFRSAYNRTGVTQRVWPGVGCTPTGTSIIISNGVAFEDVGARRSIGGY
jgi:hypothetical protein